MTAHRFFLTGCLPDEPECPVPLAADDLRHAALALRIRPGEKIDVVDPDGRVWNLTVTHCSAEGMFGRPGNEKISRPQPHVTLFQAVVKGEKMDEIVRRAVEIGVEEIVPVVTRRTVVKLDPHKRADRAQRWRRVAAAAAKQSKRATVPEVADPLKFSDAVALLAGYDFVVVLWEEHHRAGLLATLSGGDVDPKGRVALFVGPEGGLGAEEIDRLSAAGARTASLGPNILRTETASLVALTLAMAALGGLGGADG